MWPSSRKAEKYWLESSNPLDLREIDPRKILAALPWTGFTSENTPHFQGTLAILEGLGVPGAAVPEPRGFSRRLTWGHGLHVSGELAAHVVVVSADVVKTPVSQLIRAVELQRERRGAGTRVPLSWFPPPTSPSLSPACFSPFTCFSTLSSSLRSQAEQTGS